MIAIQMSSIPYGKPSITSLERETVADAMLNGWGINCYDYIYKFENLFEKYLGVKHAVATSSCTGALHLGLAALGISKGDEVIVPDSTWIASVAPIVHLGAKPIFVDVLPTTWCIDPNSVRAAITSKTKAIIAVHLYGNLADMKSLLEIGSEFGIPIIEDAAEAIGSKFQNNFAGTMGVFGVYSFHGTKTMTTGEGGLLATSSSSLYEKVLTLNNHGRSRESHSQFWSEILGYKFKISNIQAALGYAQLLRIEELVIRKREILSYYKERFSKIEDLSLNAELDGTFIGAWMSNLVVPAHYGITREDLLQALRREDIDGRVFFWPISSFPMFEPIKTNVNSWDLPTRSINLPSYHDIGQHEQDKVADTILKLFRA